ncbi:LysR family transcriptional regulator [Luteolibacter arcticus]|uniref:LysR family transcriptional regulator n=1 Tax=Luteolibacter arcticus TaxID=1581411 RepID=A0ABT3GJP8_9BACT|nr:LysR family transcriptional regulator [Luteolibacter arcticus]MCW1923749.1 LysR family transcriptional regulator [Luteolibacter arcticus]
MTPNLHHLELFYHVALNGGITAASRSMPYGIQQPAISGQITLLENDLGVRLFQRRPFKLTPEGRELYEFLTPFFSALPDMAAKIAGKASRRLRLAAPATIIRRHLPDVLASVRKARPDLELSLVDADQRAAFALLEAEQVDLAVCELEGRAPAGIRTEVLISMPLLLLLPEAYQIARSGMHGMAVDLPLIRPPADAAMTRLFARALAKAKLDWPSRIEVNSLELVHAYVAGGFGAGLSVKAPGIVTPKGTRAWQIPECPELTIAAAWRGKLSPLAELVLAGLRKRAKAG